MDQREIDRAIDRHLTRLRVIGLAFCASVAVYVGVAWLLIEILAFTGVLELPFVAATSIAVGQLLVILAGYLISRAMRKAPSSGATGVVREGAAGRSAADAEEAMQRYTQSVIVASALREVAAVVGFVLTLLTGQIVWVALLSGAALISMLVHWPRREAVRDFLQQQRMARG
jgi:hypothetical protein